MYSFFISIIIIASITVGMLALFKTSVIEKTVDRAWNETWKNENTTQDIINKIQHELKCCGDESAKDYMKINKAIPSSCCDAKTCSENSAYKIGCKEMLRDSVNFYADWIGYGSIILAIIMIVAFSSICYLKSRINYEQFV
jgi:CD63 antigen